VDKVVQLLSQPGYDTELANISFGSPGTHSTLGGIALGFARLFNSAIMVKSDITNNGADIFVQGAFAVPYSAFPKGTSNSAFLNNTYASPMAELLVNIRDIMFRSSVTIAQQNVADYVIPTPTEALDAQGT